MPDFTIRAQGAARSTEFDLDSWPSGGSYHLDLELTDWGVSNQSEPKEVQTAEGAVLYLPLDQAWGRRVIKLSGAVDCSSINDKDYKRSYLTSFIRGNKTIRRKSWEINVFGMAPVEVGMSKKTPLLLMYEATCYATPPFWNHAVQLNQIAYTTLLYPDFGTPYAEAMPSYVFAVTPSTIPSSKSPSTPVGTITASPGAYPNPHLTINNWGTAFFYGTIALAGFPASTDVYLRGQGIYRIKVTTNGSGAANVVASQRFMVYAGLNSIRFEDVNGNALNLGASASVDFGASTVRYL
jgi:hypothetical protein